MALRLDGVAKEYPGGVAALRGVSVEVPAGDQVAVVGPSGSGKTTMLTIMGTLERPTQGRCAASPATTSCKASDNELAGLRAHEIGFVFQAFHLQDVDDGAGQRRQRHALQRRSRSRRAARRRGRRSSGSGSATA